MRLNDRVSRLENATESAEAVLVWRQTGESAAEAAARYRRDNPGVSERPITVIGWLE